MKDIHLLINIRFSLSKVTTDTIFSLTIPPIGLIIKEIGSNACTFEPIPVLL